MKHERARLKSAFAVRIDDIRSLRWSAGQAVVNKFQGEPTFALTDGNYVQVEPRVTGGKYLSDPFTTELDFFPNDPRSIPAASSTI